MTIGTRVTRRPRATAIGRIRRNRILPKRHLPNLSRFLSRSLHLFLGNGDRTS